MADVVEAIVEVRKHLERPRRAGEIIGLVPTMGALHAGHAALIEQAVRECDCIAVSLFVNPMQFHRDADYQTYPRNRDADLAFCVSLAVNIVFAPSVEEMYRQPRHTFVEVEGLTEHLCGPHRPGHFRGVTTVVSNLFNIVQPDRAYFGQKDGQQLAVIRHMVDELHMPLTIVGVPTVREHDGLALSSRNQLLNAKERQAATVLYRALQASERLVAAGEVCPGEVVKQALAAIEAEPLARAEYVEVVDTEQLQPLVEITGRVMIAGAIWVGTTRLIDNVIVVPVTSTG